MLVDLLRKYQYHTFSKRKDIQLLKNIIKKDGTILDVCSGPGLYGANLMKGNEESGYIGIDNNPEYVKQGNKLFKHLELPGYFICDNAKKIPYEDNCFNQVWLFSWWVTGDDKKVFDECVRVLSPGGVLLLNWSMLYPFSFSDDGLKCVFDKLIPYDNDGLYYRYLKYIKEG